jgi:hypothetical protein
VWVPSLALTGIALAAATIAWLRLRAGLDADSLQQRLQAAWQRHQEQRRRKTVHSSKPATRGRINRKPRLVPEPVLSPVRQAPERRRRRRS